MRVAYLDEAGIAAHEPFVVVGGIVIDGDAQLSAVETHIDTIVQDYAPQHEKASFVFHTTKKNGAQKRHLQINRNGL
jgi:hypothetical protein